MSTLRVSNIEAKADVSSPTVDEKIKFTNSSGDVLFHLDGKTSGITTVGINTTGNTFTVNNTTGDVSFSGSVTSSGVSTYSNGLNVTSGSVGIGTDNPRQKLTFGSLTASSTSTPDCIDLGATYSGTNGSNLKLKLYTDGSEEFGFGASVNSRLDYVVPSNGNHVFYRGTTESLRITSGGDITFGETSSTANTTTALKSINAGLEYWNSTKGDYRAIKYKVYQSANSNVYGFGISDNLLEIQSQTNIGFFAGHSGDNTIRTERLRIASNGKVGIGSETPTEMLDVTGSGDMKMVVQTKSSGAGTNAGVRIATGDGYKWLLQVGNSTTSGGLRIYQETSGSAGERLRITSDGNITYGQSASTAITSTTIKYMDGGAEYWNGTKGDYRALRHRIYYTGIDDAYGIGVSAGMLELQSQSTMGFFTGTAGSSTGRRLERMRIDQYGKITMPYQPVFYAYQSGSASVTTTGAWTGSTWNSTKVNVGSHFNTSTSRFTAPITGTYTFTFVSLARRNGSDGSIEPTFYVNGSNVSGRGCAYTRVIGANDHDSISTTIYLYLTANDYVQTGVHAISSGTDLYYGELLGSFSGHLIG